MNHSSEILQFNHVKGHVMDNDHNIEQKNGITENCSAQGCISLKPATPTLTLNIDLLAERKRKL